MLGDFFLSTSIFPLYFAGPGDFYYLEEFLGEFPKVATGDLLDGVLFVV